MAQFTYEEVAEMIDDMGFSFTYYSYPENSAPSLPYVLFYFPGNQPETADNTNHITINTLNIELYTENKDISAEREVEAVLESNSLPYTRTETYLPEDSMYEVLYETEVIINNGQN